VLITGDVGVESKVKMKVIEKINQINWSVENTTTIAKAITMELQ
jgi:hypothetical protein